VTPIEPDWNSPEDQIYVLKASQGDALAFEALLNRYEKPVYNLCLRMLKFPSDAQDATQETFLRFHRHIKRKKTIEKVGSWLYTVARNLCRRKLRRRAWSSWIPLVSSEADQNLDTLRSVSLPSAEEDLQGEQMADLLEALLPQVPPSLREVLVFITFQGLSEQEASKILKISVNALRIRLSRAKKHLWNALQKTLKNHEI